MRKGVLAAINCGRLTYLLTTVQKYNVKKALSIFLKNQILSKYSNFAKKLLKRHSYPTALEIILMHIESFKCKLSFTHLVNYHHKRKAQTQSRIQGNLPTQCSPPSDFIKKGKPWVRGCHKPPAISFSAVTIVSIYIKCLNCCEQKLLICFLFDVIETKCSEKLSKSITIFNK